MRIKSIVLKTSLTRGKPPVFGMIQRRRTTAFQRHPDSFHLFARCPEPVHRSISCLDAGQLHNTAIMILLTVGLLVPALPSRCQVLEVWLRVMKDAVGDFAEPPFALDLLPFEWLQTANQVELLL